MSKTPNAELESRIEQAISSAIAAQGFELVRAQILAGSPQTLQIMAERLDGQGMSVLDCGAISRVVSGWLEQDVALADRFTLEVSSPGIDRPLLRLKDYRRFQGHLAKVELAQPLVSSDKPMRRFQGKIVRISEQGEEIAFATDAGEVKVPLSGIAKAKLVLTQELLDHGAKRQAGSQA